MAERALRVLIVEDEPPARRRMRALLARHPDVDVVGEASHGGEAVEEIHRLEPDLVFLDVQLPVATGFEVIEAVGVGRMPAVVFVTAYDQHAIKAFEVHALDYLLKPVEPDRLGAALARARALVRRDEAQLRESLRQALEDVRAAAAGAPSLPARLPLKVDGRIRFLGEALEFANGEPDLFEVLYIEWLADLIPTYEALFFQTTKTPQYLGYDGRYTKTMLKTERDVKRFWDIRSDDIQLLGMHGTVLMDVQRTAATYQAVFGLKPADALLAAQIVKDAVAKSKLLDGGNHPLFSFNAFAFSTGLPPDKTPIADKIVMGDGVLEGYSALGFDDVAPQAIYAHEFAHHIRYENGYFDDLNGQPKLSEAERTRYTELMADAMSAYYLTHKRGGTMNKKRVAQFLEVFFQIGDCGFDSDGHHGTPNQRRAAAQFGFAVADQAQKQGHILTSAQFYALFVKHYPTLIAPDAP